MAALPSLFTPFTVRGLTFKNRLVVSPMCQYLAVEGHVQPWHLAHHSRLALGGVGAAIVEATGVQRDGRITHGCTGLWEDGQIAGMAEITAIYKAQGVLTGIQLGHAGRKASVARPWEGNAPLTAGSPDKPWQTVSASAIPMLPNYHVPKALDEAGILKLVDDFAAAAGRAVTAGFDFIEIHGAHGYLMHQFFAAISNTRDDAYGGDLQRRMTVPLMVAKAVRGAIPASMPLFWRASVRDEVDGGVTIEQTVELAKRLKAIGVDLIDSSSVGITGHAALGNARPKPLFQVPLAKAVREGAGIATMAVGLITEPVQAEAIVRDGSADLVALGREMLADAAFPYRAALELGHPEPYSVLPRSFGFFLERRAPLLQQAAE